MNRNELIQQIRTALYLAEKPDEEVVELFIFFQNI